MKICILLGALSWIFASSVSADNIVMNPGFETGDFTGWTLFSPGGDTVVDSANPNSGSFSVDSGPVGALDFVSQVLPTTVGIQYTFAFYLASDGNTPNDFVASWDGTPVYNADDLPAFDYQLLAFNVMASSSSTAIEFGFRNDFGFFQLDDVSVDTPEPGIAWLMLLGLGTFLAVKMGRSSRSGAR
jgi:hypothetical protein